MKKEVIERLQSINIQTTKVDSWDNYDYLKKQLSQVNTEIILPKLVRNVDFIIRIGKNGKLVLTPGTELIFPRTCEPSIYCEGSLIAEGALNDKIIFTGHKWGGINIQNSPATSIKYCNINNTVGDSTHGGGIVANKSKIQILNCDIFNNYSPSMGGGILINNSEYVTINNNKIYENNAQHGGGIAIRNSRINFDNNDIYNNRSLNAAGGIYIRESNIYGNDNNIRYNQSVQGGGITIMDRSRFIGRNNRVTKNITTYIGPNRLFTTVSRDIGSYTDCIEEDNTILNHK